jgi:hypothetical protein
MRRASASVASALLLVLMVGGPNASAITNGARDGAGHRNVGALLGMFDRGDGVEELFHVCTGALMAPDLFLTAAHCVTWGATPDILFVSFDTDLKAQPDGSLSPTNVIAVRDFDVHPGLRWGGNATAYNDVAVVTLEDEVAGIEPVDLPSENFLKEQMAAGTLKRHAIVNVGYGFQTVTHSWVSPQGSGTVDGYRWVSTSPAIALTPYHLHVLAENAATGGGGICFGDSGGPHFYGAGSNLTVAVSTSADPMCEALGQFQRLDTPAVYSFLQSFLA